MKTKYVSKQCKTLKQAEQYREKLMREYNSVKLVYFPMFSESGLYQFEVRNKFI